MIDHQTFQIIINIKLIKDVIHSNKFLLLTIQVMHFPQIKPLRGLKETRV